MKQIIAPREKGSSFKKYLRFFWIVFFHYFCFFAYVSIFRFYSIYSIFVLNTFVGVTNPFWYLIYYFVFIGPGTNASMNLMYLGTGSLASRAFMWLNTSLLIVSMPFLMFIV
ncbi:hypothetical protein [[Mycoplasma] mobile]|uniref:Uncharacterized protein n=1 Tax=Mycoplasma mobile (strain ATCC 43663 / 163K / NCTC 11711) TaxID=267748 RepID=Q6KI57_MYCM1|nr:hypothetical protein [[Mycoplasma] mobile]AAT27719.1 hypothetical protein MMOB2330 [Mycoplasma mobile 163K]